MALKYTEPSDGFRNLISQKSPSTKLARSISESAPHKVFTIQIEDLEESSGLEMARQIGWRIFHSENKETVIEGYCDESDANHEFGGFNQGPFVQGTRDVLKSAEALDQTVDNDFEVAMIRLPWIYVMALWLRNESPDKDIIIPFGPLNSSFTEGKTYSQQEFIETLRAAQNARPDFNDEEGRN